MNTNSRSTELLNKVYDRLDGIELEKLTMRELSDFLEVVQKGRFLETAGQIPGFGFGGFGGSFNGPHGIIGPDGNSTVGGDGAE